VAGPETAQLVCCAIGVDRVCCDFDVGVQLGHEGVGAQDHVVGLGQLWRGFGNELVCNAGDGSLSVLLYAQTCRLTQRVAHGIPITRTFQTTG
jgi:hypothetical protein